MQIKTSVKDIPVFKPFTLALTFETADELEMFYSVFNHAAVCDAMSRHLDHTKIIRSIDQGAKGSFRYQNVFDQFHTTLRNHTCLMKK